MTRRVVGLAALAGALVVVPTASAAPGFSPARPIGNGQAPAAAFAPDGSAFVAWVAPDRGAVLTSRRGPTDRGFSKQLKVGGANVVPGSVTVARDAGTAAVAWTEQDGGATRVRLAVAAPNFGEPQTIPGASDPALALAPNGDLLVGFLSGGAGRVAVRSAAGTLGPEQPVPGATSAPQAAAAPGGGFRLVWHEAPANRIVAADTGDSGVVGPTTVLSNEIQEALGVLDLAANRGGDLVATWVADTLFGDGVAPLRTVEAASRPAAGPWSAGAPVAGIPPLVPNVDAAVNDAGDAVIGWNAATAADGSGYQAGSVFRPAGGAFGAAALREGTEAPGPVGVGLDKAGGSLLVRFEPAPNDHRMPTAILRERDGAPGEDVGLAAPQRGVSGPAVAADTFGNAIVAYGSTEPGNPVSVAAYSRSAPRVRGVVLRTTGLEVRTSEPARLSVTLTRVRGDATTVLVASVGAGRSTVGFNAKQRRFAARGGRYIVRVDASDAGPGESSRRFRVKRS